MANNYGYQYGTSPRKIEPEYQKQPVKKVKKKKVQSKKKISNNKKAKNKKVKMSFEFKFFVNSMLFFGIIFAIIACQALVNQRYKERESLKKEYNELLATAKSVTDASEDTRLLASEYGMQTKSATLINLETSDYIESSTDQVKKENKNIFTQIYNWIVKK